ncbi:hypothetical protein JTE90_018171 [Oedothorax gibbosus]|uniref:Uncharacterized protein n=1 Tax=Oedothorax gibbosus TaxID=931172 RepID=A0AAV6UA95_9ARAC|nr:hypothetical protein JTE90_018171 [Oedothorax gibbosus]
MVNYPKEMKSKLRKMTGVATDPMDLIDIYEGEPSITGEEEAIIMALKGKTMFWKSTTILEDFCEQMRNSNMRLQQAQELIGSLKRILRRVIGNACLQAEELSTVLCEAESLINSRPMTYISEDVDDLKVLSPSMFLNEIEEFGVADFEEIDVKRMNSRFAYRLRLRKRFRRSFRRRSLYANLLFILLTPHHGEDGGLNFHWIFFIVNSSTLKK